MEHGCGPEVDGARILDDDDYILNLARRIYSNIRFTWK
jgi:hypothetical protein